MATTDKSKVEQLMAIVHGKPHRPDHLGNFSQAPSADDVEEVFQLIQGYKEYSGGFIGENGKITTDSAYHLRNDLTTADPTFAYVSEGKYTLTFAADTLTASQTVVFASLASSGLCTHIVDVTVTDTEVVTIDSGAISNGAASDIIGGFAIQVRVYDI